VKRGLVPSVLVALVLACGLQAIVAAPALADTQRGRSAPRPDPKKLWKAYPLKPRAQPPSPTKPAAQALQGMRVSAPASSNGSESSFPLGLVSVSLALAILAAGGVLLVSFGLRPAWSLGAASRPPRTRRPASRASQPRLLASPLSEGGSAVSNLVHRLVHLGGERRDTTEDVAAATPEAARSSTRLDIFAPIRGRGRNETLHQARNPTPENGSETDTTPLDGGRTEAGRSEESYVQVGEQVAAVLASAEHAGKEILQTARQEAERVRAEAKDQATATLSQAKLAAERGRRESEQLRADAEAYSKETRKAADRYVAETRAKTDQEAAQKRVQADEQVLGIRRDAERKAKDLHREALERQKTLMQQVGRAEARLQQLLGIFRAMTSQLEGLVKAEPRRQSGDAEGKASLTAPLDEALRPQPSPTGPATERSRLLSE
jgi:F0F1-type ATP synthase membrane subunit b/b'